MLIISTIIKMALAPLLYLIGMIVSICKCEFNQWNFDLAVAKDQYGNTLGKYVFNFIFIKKESKHLFGNNDETISSVIGKNKKENTLTVTGKIFDQTLNLFDKNHSIKSIDDTE